MACAQESPPNDRLTSDFGNLDLSSIDRDEHMSTAPQSSEIDSTSPASLRLKTPTRVSTIRQHAVKILHACNYDVHLIDIIHGKDEFYAADGTTKTNFLRCGITPDPDTSSTIRDSLSESVTPIPSNRRTRARVQSISDQPHNPRTQTADKHVGTSIKNPLSSVPTILQPNSYNRTMLVVVMESRDKNQLLAFDTSQEVLYPYIIAFGDHPHAVRLHETILPIQAFELFSFGDIIAISTVTLLVNRASDGMIASYTVRDIIFVSSHRQLHEPRQLFLDMEMRMTPTISMARKISRNASEVYFELTGINDLQANPMYMKNRAILRTDTNIQPCYEKLAWENEIFLVQCECAGICESPVPQDNKAQITCYEIHTSTVLMRRQAVILYPMKDHPLRFHETSCERQEYMVFMLSPNDTYATAEMVLVSLPLLYGLFAPYYMNFERMMENQTLDYLKDLPFNTLWDMTLRLEHIDAFITARASISSKALEHRYVKE